MRAKVKDTFNSIIKYLEVLTRDFSTQEYRELMEMLDDETAVRLSVAQELCDEETEFDRKGDF